MRCSPRLRAVAVCVSCLACAAEEEAAELEVLVVHSSRLGATDQNALVLDATELDAERGRRAEDALRGLPGLAVARAGGVGSQAQVRVRGAEANHLMVMLDGIELNNPASGGELDFAHLSLAGASRVEVVNGPQSAVWGSDALAGLLYIDTTPAADATRIGIAGGSQATRDATLHFARVSEAGHLAATVNRFATGGGNISRRGDEEDGYRNATFHANAGRRIGGWGFNAVAREMHARSEFDPAPFPAFLPTDGDLATHAARRYLKLEAMAEGGAHWLPRFTLTRARSHDETKAEGRTTAALRGERTTLTFSNNFALGEGHLLSATLERERQRFRQRAAATAFGDPNQRQGTTTNSAALEYQHRRRSTLFTLAGRWDANSAFADAAAWRVGASRRLGEGWVFANVGTGVKNPTFIERFGYFATGFIGNPRLQPETATEAEVGFAGGRFSLTAFHARLRDEIAGFVFDGEQGGFTARNRADRSRRRGIEANLNASLGRFDAWLRYAFVDAREAGRHEVRRPRHQGRVDIAGPLTPRLRLIAGVALVGEREDEDFAMFPATRRALPRYALAHGALELAVSSGATAWLHVENAFDVDYEDVFGYRGLGLRALAGVRFDL